jgi:hypothetical protein
MGLLICALYILAEAALIAAVFYLVIWGLSIIFKTPIPERVIQLLGLALFIYVLVAILACFMGAGGPLLLPWRPIR